MKTAGKRKKKVYRGWGVFYKGILSTFHKTEDDAKMCSFESSEWRIKKIRLTVEEL